MDNAGRQKNTADVASGGVVQPYEGLTVFESNKVITEVLREHGALLSASYFEHSYPHCWRCHNPVIVRATEQWFIGMETLMPSVRGRKEAGARGARILRRLGRALQTRWTRFRRCSIRWRTIPRRSSKTPRPPSRRPRLSASARSTRSSRWCGTRRGAKSASPT